MSIRKLFTDRDELAHLVDQEIDDMEVIGDASVEGFNGMDQFFAESSSVDGVAAF